MQLLFLLFFGCVLVAGCAAHSPPPKPSPYHYGKGQTRVVLRTAPSKALSSR